MSNNAGPEFVVVDLDTGTILGTNVVLVPVENLPEDGASDSEIIEAAEKFCYPLCADICFASSARESGICKL